MLLEDVLQISSETGSNTRLLGGSVHGHEDKVGLLNGLVDVRGEEEVAVPCLADDILETWLVDGELEVGAVPRIDSGLVEVDDGDLDVGAFEGNDSACRTTWTA